MIIKKLLLFFIICANLTTAQNFLPLKVGNQYQFKNYWWVDGPGGYYDSGTDYYALTILSDTLIDGEVFYRFPNTGSYSPFPGNFLFRYDSLNQKIFIRIPNDDTTRLAVDFNTPADSQYISYIRGEPKEFISDGLSFQTVLGDTHSVYSMKYYFQGIEIPGHVYYYSDQIGLYKYSYYWSPGMGASSSTHTLISAIIDSVIYNPLTLQVDTLYPVMDRPADTFPFLLTIPYSVSYYPLIDSFYLSAEHFREDTLVQSKEFEISIYNPHITFYLEGLEAGDIIKLKATITDTSIYNNRDYYPDSGWVIINVLPPVSGVESGDGPFTYKLEQNYPNPFNPTTTIYYEISGRQKVELKIFDMLGNEVATLVDGEKPAGRYEIKFDGSSLPSGVYFYQIKAGTFVNTKKMVLAK
ncbi:hypothetical protein BMS3Abin03_00913 [bacterium BMS3Abin03]|nr:hypothetical protein BMS3Abin03_00913 [bacterium BMS3Abin03]